MQTGFNLQFGHFVVGGEGSFIGNGTNTFGKSHEFQVNQLFAETIGQNITAETDFTSMRKVETTWNGFVGGKIGFCWNRLLFYGTGGAAFTDAHFESWQTADTSFFGFVGKTVTPNPPANFIGEVVSKKMHTQGDVLTGWFGGGGVDFKLTNIVSTGVEYKHVDWGDVTEHLIAGVNGGPVFPGNGHLGLNADQVVFKVNILIGH
jgi:outer membrane immunogenic protein